VADPFTIKEQEVTEMIFSELPNQRKARISASWPLKRLRS